MITEAIGSEIHLFKLAPSGRSPGISKALLNNIIINYKNFSHFFLILISYLYLSNNSNK